VISQAVLAQQASSATLYLQVVESLLHHDSVIPIVLDVNPLKTMYNREAIVPQKCYTDTEGIYNPCDVCHQM